MEFVCRQFGALKVEQEHIYVFEEGIIGFENLRRFIIIDDEDSQPFRWLVSLDDGDLSFPLLHPSLILERYEVPVAYEATIFLVAVLSENLEESAVNLRAPIVINQKERTGRQMVLEDDRLSVQHRLFPARHAGAGA